MQGLQAEKLATLAAFMPCQRRRSKNSHVSEMTHPALCHR